MLSAIMVGPWMVWGADEAWLDVITAGAWMLAIVIINIMLIITTHIITWVVLQIRVPFGVLFYKGAVLYWGPKN